MPTRVNSSKPMMIPNIPKRTPNINVRGSNKERCFPGIPEGSYFSTLLIGKPILPILVFYWKYDMMSIFFLSSFTFLVKLQRILYFLNQILYRYAPNSDIIHTYKNKEVIKMTTKNKRCIIPIMII